MLAGLCMHEGDPSYGVRPLPVIRCTLGLIRQESIDFVDGVHLSMHGCLRSKTLVLSSVAWARTITLCSRMRAGLHSRRITPQSAKAMA